MKSKSRSRRLGWNQFITGNLFDDDIVHLTSEDCCKIPGDLWGLEFILEERSCWARYAILITLLSFLLFLLAELVLSLWRAIRNCFGCKEKSKKSIESIQTSNRNCLEESQCKESTRTKSLLEVQCADDSDMQSARSCTSTLLNVDYGTPLACAEDIQDKKVTIDTNVPKPYTVLSEHYTSTEYLAPKRQMSRHDTYNDSQLSELDTHYRPHPARWITLPDCCCQFHPCVCNCQRRSSCWDSDYYSKYNTTLNRDYNVDNYLPSRYDVDALGPNYLLNNYQPKSRHEINREGSVEFLFSRTDDIRPNNIVPRLRACMSRQHHQFQPHHSTWNEAQRVPSDSPLRYTRTPERSHYNEHFTNNDWHQLDTSPLKNSPKETQYTKDQNDYTPLSPIYSPESFPSNGYNNNDTRILDGAKNKRTTRNVDKYGDEHSTDNKHSTERSKSSKQPEISGIDRTLETQSKRNNNLRETYGRSFYITNNIPKVIEKMELLENNHQIRSDDTSKLRQNIGTNPTFHQETSSKNETDKNRITETHKLLNHQKEYNNEIRLGEKDIGVSREARHQPDETHVGKKLLILHNHRCEPRERAKIHKYIGKLDPSPKLLPGTPSQTDAAYPQSRNILRDGQDSHRPRDSQLERSEPDSSGITSSEDGKVITYDVATTANIASDDATEMSADINQPDNIKPQHNFKSKNLFKAKQSPVDIVMKDCLPLYFENPLTWYSYNNVPLSMTINNWNETVALSAVWNINETPCLSGGPMFSDVYRFDKLIFKWGACDHTGSEHTTDGQFYALERQMIFRRDNMSSALSLGESVRVGHCNNPDCNMKNCNRLRHCQKLTSSKKCPPNMTPSPMSGNTNGTKKENNIEYVILSSFYQIFDCDPYSRNASLDNILKYVNIIQYPDTSYSIPMFSLVEIQKPFNCDYFSYFGSLTVPPYTESVLWIIEPDVSFVSKQQMENFRAIKSEKGDNVLSNRRMIQPLNRRTIYLCC